VQNFQRSTAGGLDGISQPPMSEAVFVPNDDWRMTNDESWNLQSRVRLLARGAGGGKGILGKGISGTGRLH
jgi:hypothetical protein